MKKVVIRALSLMLAFMFVFGAFSIPASAASTDAKAKALCKTLNKGRDAASCIDGSYKVKYKKKGNTYYFTVTFNTKLDASYFQMSKIMVPDKYNETVDSLKKVTLDIKKKAKKAGIKKVSVKYIVKANGEKLWVFKNGKQIYDKFE